MGLKDLFKITGFFAGVVLAFFVGMVEGFKIGKGYYEDVLFPRVGIERIVECNNVNSNWCEIVWKDN